MSSAEVEPRGPIEAPPHDDEVVPYERMEWTRPWMGAFLRSLSSMPVVTVACRVARVSTTVANDWRGRDEAFAAAWVEAWNRGVDAMEQEAHTRAMLGRPKTITRTRVKRDQEGNVVEEERVETTIHETSDPLLVALLRANRPEKWREKGDIRVTGADGGPVQHELVTSQAAAPRSAERLREVAQVAVDLELAAPPPPPDYEGEAELVSDEPVNGAP